MFDNGLFWRIPDLYVEIVKFVRKVSDELIPSNHYMLYSELFQIFIVFSTLFITQIDIFSYLV